MTLARSASGLRALRDRSPRILAVFAHPDDESYGCGGMLARHGARADAATALLCLTRGEASSMGPARGLTADEVGALREARLVEVAGILRLDGLLVAGLGDGRLARAAQADVARPIAEALDAFDPTLVITHDARGVNGHADHIATHWAVRRVLEGRDRPRLALVAYPPDVAEASRPRLLFATPVGEIDVVAHLDEAEVRAKQACLDVHEGIITLQPGDGTDRPLRPPTECYDLWNETHRPPRADFGA